MKTIYGFIFLVIMFFASFKVSAESASSSLVFPYTFSLGTSTGLLVGQGEEIVYQTTTSDNYLSELLWDIKPLVYFGTAINVSRIDQMEKWGIFGDVSFKFGIPMKTGIMEDRDWLDSARPDHVTNFSSHDNYTQGAFLADISIGSSFPVISKTLLLKGYIAYSYMHFSWISQDGYLQYESQSWEKIPISGPAISYAQEWHILSFAIGSRFSFLRFFSIAIDFKFSPSLIWCTAQDEHFSRNLQFDDTVYGGFFLEPNMEVVFSPYSKVDISLGVNYRLIKGLRGTSESTSTGFSTVNNALSPPGVAGAGYNVWDIGLSVKVRL
ncbi:MAG: omptin family outer membrane protease [Treponema sp.]|jgi:outer membrane protease|nr:omptin family outer membrane protease [Treponema sp.]